MDLLSKLFGHADKVKIMRLFILNPELVLAAGEVSQRSKVPLAAARREATGLEHLGLLKSRTTISPLSLPAEVKLTKVKVAARRQKGWQLDLTFPFITQLRSILRTDLISQRRNFSRRFNAAGKIKFLAISGIFLDLADSRVDLVIVGDHLKKRILEKEIQTLEAEIGKELVYAIFETSDFEYRLNACDKFVRDILDYPHERIIDRLSTSSILKPLPVV